MPLFVIFQSLFEVQFRLYKQLLYMKAWQQQDLGDFQPLFSQVNLILTILIISA